MIRDRLQHMVADYKVTKNKYPCEIVMSPDNLDDLFREYDNATSLIIGSRVMFCDIRIRLDRRRENYLGLI